MKAISEISFDKLVIGLPVIIPAGKIFSKATGKIMGRKRSFNDGTPRSDIVIDWDSAGIRVYIHEDMKNIYFNEI